MQENKTILTVPPPVHTKARISKYALTTVQDESPIVTNIEPGTMLPATPSHPAGGLQLFNGRSASVMSINVDDIDNMTASRSASETGESIAGRNRIGSKESMNDDELIADLLGDPDFHSQLMGGKSSKRRETEQDGDYHGERRQSELESRFSSIKIPGQDRESFDLDGSRDDIDDPELPTFNFDPVRRDVGVRSGHRASEVGALKLSRDSFDGSVQQDVGPSARRRSSDIGPLKLSRVSVSSIHSDVA